MALTLAPKRRVETEVARHRINRAKVISFLFELLLYEDRTLDRNLLTATHGLLSSPSKSKSSIRTPSPEGGLSGNTIHFVIDATAV
jgi:hypothetical protein